jgi:hypothetical protein
VDLTVTLQPTRCRESRRIILPVTWIRERLPLLATLCLGLACLYLRLGHFGGSGGRLAWDGMGGLAIGLLVIILPGVLGSGTELPLQATQQ